MLVNQTTEESKYKDFVTEFEVQKQDEESSFNP